jgi:predicted DNA-binding transcriptional regulator AlpA
MSDPVGVVEIVERLGVTRKHVDAWRTRGRRGVPFPEPAWTVGGRPAWLWDEVQEWHTRTQP